MKKILQGASLAKMMNQARWWAQSLKQYSITWSVVGKTRWAMIKCRDQAWETRPTASVRGIRSTGRPNRRFRLSFNLKRPMMQRHQCCQQLMSVWRLLKASQENCKCCKWLLDQRVVIWGEVSWTRGHTNAFCPSRAPQCRICCCLRNQSISNPHTLTPAYRIASWLPYRNRILTKTLRWLLRRRRNELANWHFSRCIKLKCDIRTYFATCQPLLDFSDQIVRHDNSSMDLQRSDRTCRCSRLQISFNDDQWTWYHPARH